MKMGGFTCSPASDHPRERQQLVNESVLRERLLWRTRGSPSRLALQLVQLLLLITFVGVVSAADEEASYTLGVVVGRARRQPSGSSGVPRISKSVGSEYGASAGSRSLQQETLQHRALEKKYYLFTTSKQKRKTRERIQSEQQVTQQKGNFDRHSPFSAPVTQQQSAKHEHATQEDQLQTLLDAPHVIRRQQQLLPERQQPRTRRRQRNSVRIDRTRHGQHEVRQQTDQEQHRRTLGSPQQTRIMRQEQQQYSTEHSQQASNSFHQRHQQSGRVHTTAVAAFAEKQRKQSEDGDEEGRWSQGANVVQTNRKASLGAEERKMAPQKKNRDAAILCAAPTCSEEEVEEAVKEIMRRVISMRLPAAKKSEEAPVTGQQQPFRIATNVQVEKRRGSVFSSDARGAGRKSRTGSAVTQSEYVFWEVESEDEGEREEEMPLHGQERRMQMKREGKKFSERGKNSQDLGRAREDFGEKEQEDGNCQRKHFENWTSPLATAHFTLGQARAPEGGPPGDGRGRQGSALDGKREGAIPRDNPVPRTSSSAAGTSESAGIVKSSRGVIEEKEAGTNDEMLLSSSNGERAQHILSTATDGEQAATGVGKKNGRRKEPQKRLAGGTCAVDSSTLKHLHCRIIKLRRCRRYIDPDLLIEIAETHPCISDAALDEQATPYVIEEETRRIPSSFLRSEPLITTQTATTAAPEQQLPHANSEAETKKQRGGESGSHSAVSSSASSLANLVNSSPKSSSNNADGSNTTNTEDNSRNATSSPKNPTDSSASTNGLVPSAEEMKSHLNGPGGEKAAASGARSPNASPADSPRERKLYSAYEGVQRDSNSNSSDTPDDPLFHTVPQWELRARFSGIGALDAWKETKGGSGYISEQPANTVAIIDFGFYLKHEDLWDTWWRNTDRGRTTGQSEWPNNCDNGIDDDENGYVDDCYGYSFALESGTMRSLEGPHGTAVASLCCANTNNNKGVAAIGWNLRPMALQTDGSYAEIAEALNYAADKGVKVVNFSLGGPPTRALRRIVEEAQKRDITLIVAAGNHQCNLGLINTKDCRDEKGDFKGYPAAYSDRYFNLITVAASDVYARGTDFTNYDSTRGAPRVQVVAPGKSLAACNASDDPDEEEYATVTGTSFAAPMVAGIAGLLRYKWPDLSATDVRNILVKSCVPVSYTNLPELSQCGGILSAAKALQMAKDLSLESDKNGTQTSSSSDNSNKVSGAHTKANTSVPPVTKSGSIGYVRYPAVNNNLSGRYTVGTGGNSFTGRRRTNYTWNTGGYNHGSLDGPSRYHSTNTWGSGGIYGGSNRGTSGVNHNNNNSWTTGGELYNYSNSNRIGWLGTWSNSAAEGGLYAYDALDRTYRHY